MFLKVTEYCPTRIQSGCRAVKNVKDSFGYKQRAVSSNSLGLCCTRGGWQHFMSHCFTSLFQTVTESSLQENGKMLLLRMICSKQPFPQAAGMRYNPTQGLQLYPSRTTFVPLSVTCYIHFWLHDIARPLSLAEFSTFQILCTMKTFTKKNNFVWVSGGWNMKTSWVLGGRGHSDPQRVIWSKDPSLVHLNEFYRHRLRHFRKRVNIAACSVDVPLLQNAWKMAFCQKTSLKLYTCLELRHLT